MSLQILPEQVCQESSAKITASFKDVDDQSAITPESVSWTLMALDGTVINSRSGVVVAPASTVEIWLSADDLELIDNDNEYELRRIRINATYDNGTSVVPLIVQGQFAVYNVTGVS